MIQALILINVERGNVPQTAQQLLKIDGLYEVFSVTGEFDLVALVRVKEYDDLANVVTAKVAQIPSIIHTTTMVAFKVYSRDDIEQSFNIGVE
ncbi:Lrp/AsnC ligand binding domain-containing protein [Candidatus Chlorohelix sp.]|uniref:Lrp/AsnC family transcriptional regulator n=1 Tax=Candidatus Chlorohelix sp. TaxID=3139201 RepID=UPI00302A1EC6